MAQMSQPQRHLDRFSRCKGSQCISVGRTTPKIVHSLGDRDPNTIHGFWAHPSQSPKRCSRSRSAHEHDQQTDTHRQTDRQTDKQTDIPTNRPLSTTRAESTSTRRAISRTALLYRDVNVGAFFRQCLHAGGRGPRAFRFVRFWASGGAKFTEWEIPCLGRL